MSFGILIPQLGYYWDDWMTLYLSFTYRDPTALVYQPFRPIHAWLDVVTLSIVGTNPIYWHCISLLFRWLTAWGVWEVLRRIWAERREEVAWIAILFTVYPSFLQQSVAVIFRPHWFSFIFFLVSVLCMLAGYRNKKWYLLLTLLGVLTTIVHLFNSEYLVGLELTRPFILWIIITREVDSRRERIKQTVKHWSPYLLILLVFAIWRVFFVQIENDPNTVISISAILSNPASLIDIVIAAFRDLLHMFLTSWYKTLQPDLISIENPSDVFVWLLAFLTFIGLLFVMRSAKFGNTGAEDGWKRHALMFSFFATFVALLPIWITGRNVIVGMWSDRLSVPAMFGASIFLVSAIGKVIPSRKNQNILFCILVGLAVATQFRAGNDFRWDWIRQKRTYWQMYWRAPAIAPDTPIISDGALTSFVSRYTAAFALNMLYPQDENGDLPTYWYFEIQYNKLANRIPELVDGVKLRDEFYSVKFNGSSKNSILIFTPSGEDRCLWFLTPEDVDNEEIPLEMRQLSAIVNLDRILPEPFNNEYPIEDIFGPEPEHTWCYFYQKASLAHQLGDWGQVIKLWEEAEKLGYKTKNLHELIPFIEANAALVQWDQAVAMTQIANNLPKSNNSLLCDAWERFNQGNKGSEEFDLAYEATMNSLDCQ